MLMPDGWRRTREKQFDGFDQFVNHCWQLTEMTSDGCWRLRDLRTGYRRAFLEASEAFTYVGTRGDKVPRRINRRSKTLEA